MRVVKFLLRMLFASVTIGLVVAFFGFFYFSKNLPNVAELKDVKLQTPLYIYSAEDELIAIFGERRRIPVKREQIPQQLVDAFIAIEDSRFYDHFGIDPKGIARAIYIGLRTGNFSQGGSTITQQVAKNFYLSSERNIVRKIKEAILALRIEKHYSKDEIMALYLNKIYFGARSYGVAVAAHSYFGKKLDELTLGEIAILAGLPKAPSKYNPIYSKDLADLRRNLVLGRMLHLGFITQEQYDEAKNESILAKYHELQVSFPAPYLAEMVRAKMFAKYGEAAYNDGFRVYTTLKRQHQLAATHAVQKNVIDYDMRHGYRGAEKVLWEANTPAWNDNQIVNVLKEMPKPLGFISAAVVLKVADEQATLMMGDGNKVSLTFEGVRWARKYLDDKRQGPLPTNIAQVIQSGQQIWVRHDGKIWWLSQVPQVNSAFVSLSPDNGAITALVGGIDFSLSKFNRVTQSVRQVGSSIKPFIYAAALDKGLTMATLLNDAPIVRNYQGSDPWRPRNSPEKYEGPLRLRVGIGTSKNVMMVRTVRAIGIDYASGYLKRFGFPLRNVSRTESLALGAASFTPLQMARGYSVFANGGYLVDPYFIERIEDSDCNILYQAMPKIACKDCSERYIDHEASFSVTPDDEVEKQWDDNAVNEIKEFQEELIDMDSLIATNNFDFIDDLLGNTPYDQVDYAPRVINEDLAFIISDGLVGNIWGEKGESWRGTGWRAKSLKRQDIGGKTGTTNFSKDAWYNGFGPDLVSVVWIGFDDHQRELGRSGLNVYSQNTYISAEGAARTAQPAWIDFMHVVLDNEPIQSLIPPKRVKTALIDKRSGLLSEGGPYSREEYFIEGTIPKNYHVEHYDMSVIDEENNRNELF